MGWRARRREIVKYGTGAGLVALIAGYASVSSAGSGTILPPDMAPSVANRIELQVHLKASASQAQLDLLKQQMRAANRTICDMTDGNFRISKVTATRGEASEGTADIWWYPNLGRATAGQVGHFGEGAGNHVLLYGFDPSASTTGFTGATIAHELGHHIFGLLDQYPEGPRGVSFDGPDQLSDALTVGATTLPIGPFFRSQFGAPFFHRQRSDALSSRNNSIMQQSMHQVCVVSDPTSANFGLADGDINPILRQDDACLSNADCSGGYVCQTPDSGVSTLDTVQRSSEFSIRTNYDPVKGTFSAGSPTTGLEAKELVVLGFLAANETPNCGDANTESPPHADLGQQCGRKGGQASCAPGSAGNVATCDRCLIEKSFCFTAVNTCGNGQLESGEECDNGQITTTPVGSCSQLPALTGGSLYCNVNCLFDTNECSPTLTPPLDESSLVNAAASSTFWTSTLAYDQDGVTGHAANFRSETALTPLNFDRLGRSEHAIYLFASQRTRTFTGSRGFNQPGTGTHELWTLVFAADKAEFGGPAGGLQKLGTYEIELVDAQYAAAHPPLAAMTVLSGPAQLLLGKDTPTGPFTRNTNAKLTLAPKLAGLLMVSELNGFQVPTRNRVHRFWNGGSLYARNGVSADGSKEVPQYAAPPSSLWSRIAFNAQSGRYEASAQSIWFGRRALDSTYEIDIPGFPKLTPDQVAVNQAGVDHNDQNVLPQVFPSDWEIASTVLSARWGITIAPPLGLPDPRFNTTDANMDTIPDQCPDPEFVLFDPTVLTANDQVIFVLDRSGSMATLDSPGAGDLQGLARLDFTKAAADALLNLLKFNDEPQFGLVWFSDGAETKVGSMAALRHLVSGTLADDPVNDKIGIQTVIDTYLRQSNNPPETPVANGFTGTAAALKTAATLFEPANGGVRMIVLLTDGLANIPLGGAGSDDAANRQRALADVKTVTDQLALDKIQVETVTTGSDAPQTMAQGIASTTGGTALDAPRSQEIAPSFLEVYGKLHGDQLVRSHQEMPRLGVVFSRIVPIHDIQVEHGAQALTVIMSDNQQSCTGAGCPYLGNPRLTDPQGNLVAPTVMSSRYSLWRIPAPSAGQWQLADISDFGQWQPGAESRPWRSLVSAVVHNPNADCLASVSKAIVNDDQSVTVAVTPYSGQPVRTGASVSGYMLRPDRVQVPLTFTSSDLDSARRTVIKPSQFVGQGTYVVTARCDVTAGAEREIGEDPPGNDNRLAKPLPSEDTEAFTREVTKTFWVNSATQPSLPGTVTLQPGQVDRGQIYWGDGDLDRIPNGAESSGDYDHDGIVNSRDSDANGNDKPDATDGALLPQPNGNYERWDNVSGTAVANIPLNREPDFVSTLSTLEAPTNVGDNFGARITGLISPPTSGNYTFFISGDDNVALYLSSSADPANKVRIAYHNGFTGVREWNKFATQKSAPTPLQAGSLYYIEAQMKEGAGADHMAVGWLKPGQSGTTPSEITPLPFPASSQPKGDGYLIYEKWINVTGSNVSDIPLNRAPDYTENRSELRAPSNIREDYGVRMRGWITAPSSGAYTFWISGDDHVALYFSRTGLPANKERIAYHDSYTGELEWNRFSTQKSASINLVAGRRYYVEALMKESSGNDHVAVGWLKPGQTGSVPSEVIPGSQLSPYVEPVLPPGAVACVSQALPRVSASASSQESSALSSSKAIDGNVSTRWSSLFSDPQWLTVDLGEVQHIGRVKLTWEAAASADYDLRVSDDNINWRTIYTDSQGNGGVDDITSVSTTARYVRMYSRSRKTVYGNSLFEMEVFGDANEDCFAVLGERYEAKRQQVAERAAGGCSLHPASGVPRSHWAWFVALASALSLARRRYRRGGGRSRTA